MRQPNPAAGPRKPSGNARTSARTKQPSASETNCSTAKCRASAGNAEFSHRSGLLQHRTRSNFSHFLPLPACGERVGVRGVSTHSDSPRVPLTRRCAPTSPRKRGEVARPLRHADGSIDRRGLAGGFGLPGLGGKCADARSRIAETSVDVTHRRAACRGDTPEPPQALSAWPRRSGQPAEVQALSFNCSIGYESHDVWLRLIEMERRPAV